MAERRRCAGAAAVFTLCSIGLAPALALADEGRPKVHGIEVQGVALARMLPTTVFGVDASYFVGNETFQFRVGAIIAGAPAFRLGSGKVANAMQLVQADGCAGRTAQRHRIRMCVGGQAGVWEHRWIDVRTPGKRASPWVAGTLRGDYRYNFTERIGLMFGVGVTVPAVGPSFRGEDALGRKGPLILPGPIGGSITIGTSFAFG